VFSISAELDYFISSTSIVIHLTSNVEHERITNGNCTFDTTGPRQVKTV